uniref:Pyruvate kinase n=1 Tax=Theropithecus gelada TaxID=9565 RepID=A0A8D2EMV9_THEGE
VADTFLEHMCRLDIHIPPITAWNTGIICTNSPASRSVEKLKEMIKSGMNVACLNFSHGTHEYHVESIKNVHTATEIFASDPILYRHVALALDTKGPEIRTGLIKDSSTAEVGLKMGATLKIMLENAYMKKCDENILWLDYKNICKVTEVGSKIYVDDGLISLQVKQKGADFLVTEVENGGSLGSKKGVNLPGAAVDLPAVSEKDIQDPKFGVEQDVDMVFTSFIHKASDVHEVRKVARYRPRAPIIAVTRNPQTAGQAHLHHGIFPVLCQDPVQEARAEDVDRWVDLAMNVDKAGSFFKKGDVDVAIALIGWRPGSGFTNTVRVVSVW